VTTTDAPTTDARFVLRLRLAMLAAGLASFGLLYCTQALLPAIGSAFQVSPTVSSLTVSATTGALALALLPMSSLAESLGRTRVMRVGLAVAVFLTLATASAPWFWAVLVGRALTGLALAGVLAVAMGHLGEELPAHHLGSAMGLYVAGTSLGGVLARIIPGVVTDYASWRWGLVALALFAGLAVVAFVTLLPPARRYEPVPPRIEAHLSAVREVWADPGVRRLCLVSLLAMGGFVACYNYLTYRLISPPINLDGTVASLLFLAYLPGALVSSAAGRLAQRVGRARTLSAGALVSVIGLALTLPNHIGFVTVGLVVFTCGFFAVHSGASAWVATRSRQHPSHASALYLMSYYLGSSVLGTAGGQAWLHGGWLATAAMIAVLYLLVMVAAAGVRSNPTAAEGVRSSPTAAEGVRSSPTAAEGVRSSPTAAEGVRSNPAAAEGVRSDRPAGE
jgi:YNFM family putative membrane transporter